jgi:uncharacterized protein (TIGR03437 family)
MGATPQGAWSATRPATFMGRLTVAAHRAVTYEGLAPTFVGLYQFNVVIPNIPAKDKAPVTFTLNGTAGTQTLALPVQ